MARVTVEDCLEKVNNRFALVHLVSKRAKQLLKGSQPVISKVKNKFVVTALREVADGLVQFEFGEEDPSKMVEQDLTKNNLH